MQSAHLLFRVILSLCEASGNFWCFWRRVQKMVNFPCDGVIPPSRYSLHQNLIRHLYKQHLLVRKWGSENFMRKKVFFLEIVLKLTITLLNINNHPLFKSEREGSKFSAAQSRWQLVENRKETLWVVMY